MNPAAQKLARKIWAGKKPRAFPGGISRQARQAIQSYRGKKKESMKRALMQKKAVKEKKAEENLIPRLKEIAKREDSDIIGVAVRTITAPNEMIKFFEWAVKAMKRESILPDPEIKGYLAERIAATLAYNRDSIPENDFRRLAEQWVAISRSK